MAKHRGYVSKLAIYNYPEICQAFIFKKMGLLYSVDFQCRPHPVCLNSCLYVSISNDSENHGFNRQFSGKFRGAALIHKLNT